MIHPQTQSQAFVAGLLQDMAVPLLASIHADRYGPMLEHGHEDARSRLDALEDSEFGWNHSGVGEAMANTWGLPQELSAAIADHHGACAGSVVPSVRLASYIRESESDLGIEPLVEACREEFSLPADKVVERVQSAFEEAAALAALLN